jgi:hypothetical protein
MPDHTPLSAILKTFPDVEVVSQMIYDNGVQGLSINIYFKPDEVEKLKQLQNEKTI